MSGLSIIFTGVISFIMVGAAGCASISSSEKPIPTNEPTPPPAKSKKNNLYFQNPKYVTNWSETYPASLQPAGTGSISSILKKLETIISTGWQTNVDGNVVTIFRDEEVNFYNCMAMRLGAEDEDRAERLESCNCKGKYGIKLLVSQLISKSDYKKLEKGNAPCEKMYRENSPAKTPFEEFRERNPDCLYKEQPEFYGQDYSIYITQSKVGGFCVYPQDAASECSQVYKNVRKLFNAYEDN